MREKCTTEQMLIKLSLLHKSRRNVTWVRQGGSSSYHLREFFLAIIVSSLLVRDKFIHLKRISGILWSQKSSPKSWTVFCKMHLVKSIAFTQLQPVHVTCASTLAWVSNGFN